MSEDRFFKLMKTNEAVYLCILRHIHRETPEDEEQFLKSCDK